MIASQALFLSEHRDSNLRSETSCLLSKAVYMHNLYNLHIMLSVASFITLASIPETMSYTMLLPFLFLIHGCPVFYRVVQTVSNVVQVSITYNQCFS
ncbi:hypothetical protein BDV96DRAFT_217724 [Lophiotrema nucula]|uniref:Uncharacterized protein n=1 Tax=Lophiotrema nucula TaxID=690887 RepID=A0A6A5ZPL9_9PLEO|nr:hypothetical protein BDV96DRAFT_217724 [Lophiotrema nucula]